MWPKFGNCSISIWKVIITSRSKVPVQVLEVAAVKYFTNHSTLDVLQGSKYGSGYSSLLKQSL